MFDIGFWEISLIMVVLLLVVGPERLPKLARTAGIYIGKARRMVAEVKAEVNRELRAQELKETLGAQGIEQLKGTADELRSIGSDLKSDVQTFGTELKEPDSAKRPSPKAGNDSKTENEAPKEG